MAPMISFPISKSLEIKRITRLHAARCLWHCWCSVQCSEAIRLLQSSLPMLTVRNAWTGLDGFEKLAVVFAALALTMAAWALGAGEYGATVEVLADVCNTR